MTAQQALPQTKNDAGERVIIWIAGLIFVALTIAVAIVETILFPFFFIIAAVWFWLDQRPFRWDWCYFFTKIFGAIATIAILLAINK